MSFEFPEPTWAVPMLLPEGLSLIVSPPKVGKSWLALGLAVAVASGGRALGKIPVEAGDVLYAALEDTPRRLQSRLRVVLKDDTTVPTRLTFITECKRLDEGGLETLGGWLDRHPDARLVIVDVFAKIKAGARRSANVYDSDYDSTSGLKQLADKHGVAILLVHHTRKQGDDDFLQTVSGSNGIAGSADTLLVLSRSRSSADAVLQITGRDVEEAEHPLCFDGSAGQWTLLDGTATDYKIGETRRRILEALRELGGGRAKDVAEHLRLKDETVRKTLNRMANDGQIDSDNHGTFWPLDVPVVAVPSVPAVPPLSGVADQNGWDAASQDDWDAWDGRGASQDGT
jgi:hypothetical protein